MISSCHRSAMISSYAQIRNAIVGHDHNIDTLDYNNFCLGLIGP